MNANPDAIEQKRLSVLAPWVQAANLRIDRQVADARAHAERALHQAIIDTREGRQTYRLIAARKAHQAALDRLDDLCRYLVGSGPNNLAGHVQDARADFYRQAFEDFATMLPASIRNERAQPDQRGEKLMRGMTVHGLTARQELEPAFTTARNALKTTVNAMLQRGGGSDEQRADVLTTWENRTAGSIKQKTNQLLSDSEVAIWTLVGRYCVRPELRSQPENDAA